MPGPHHLARVPVAKGKGVQGDVLAERGTVGVASRLAEDQADFLLGMDQLRLADGLESAAAQQPKSGVVEQPDGGIEEFVEPLQRLRDPEGSRQRLLDGQGFRREFAHDDVQEGDDGETDREGEPVGLGGVNAEVFERGRQQGGEDRLAHPAQAQAGEGNAELGRAEGRVEIANNAARNRGAPVTFGDEGFELGVADFDEGELSRNEEAVEQNQQRHGCQFQDCQ